MNRYTIKIDHSGLTDKAIVKKSQNGKWCLYKDIKKMIKGNCAYCKWDQTSKYVKCSFSDDYYCKDWKLKEK